MQRLVQERVDDIRRLCEKYRVRRLEIFGSGLEDRFDPEKSDLDFLVEFEELPRGKRADAYFDLMDELQNLFGRPVDLVMASAVRNRYFRQQLEATKVPLYAAGD